MKPGLDNMTGYYSTSNETQQRQLYNTSTYLFAADLPDGTCEEDLYGFFNGYKMVYSKVIQNINKTYAFVVFETRNDAERARRELNGVTIQAKYASGINKVSKPVRLCRYESRNVLSNIDPRCNLLVKNLSPQVSAHLLFNTFIKYGDVRSSKLMVDIMGESKGFGFISYYRWEDSISAVEHLNGTELGGKNIKINFLEKGRHRQVKRNNIYVKEIPKKNFSDKELIDLFSKYGKINSAIVLKDEKGESKGFGFVCFEKPEDAEVAQKEMNGKKIFDDVENKLYVSFALKKAERKEELIKMKEKLFKESQKMTIYAKSQNDEKIKTEDDFKNRIMDYLKRLMGQDYKPKLIKVRMEQKNALITINRTPEKKKIEIPSKYESPNTLYTLNNSHKKILTPYGGNAIIKH
jgi:polyadenylate-binding protein